MKTLLYLIAASALFLSACTTQYQARGTYDDVYYSPKDAPVYTQTTPDNNQDTQAAQAADAGSYTQAEEQQYSQPETAQTYDQQ